MLHCDHSPRNNSEPFHIWNSLTECGQSPGQRTRQYQPGCMPFDIPTHTPFISRKLTRSKVYSFFELEGRKMGSFSLSFSSPSPWVGHAPGCSLNMSNHQNKLGKNTQMWQICWPQITIIGHYWEKVTLLAAKAIWMAGVVQPSISHSREKEPSKATRPRFYGPRSHDRLRFLFCGFV